MSDSDDNDDCVILEIKSFDDLETNNLRSIIHSKRLSGFQGSDIKTPLLKKVFDSKDLSINRTFENENCKTLTISKAKPYEYIYINDDDDDDDDDKNGDENSNNQDDYVIIIEAKAFEDEIIHKLANLPLDNDLNSNTSSDNELAIIAERGQVFFSSSFEKMNPDS